MKKMNRAAVNLDCCDDGQVRCLLDERGGDAVTVAAVADVVRAATSPSRSAPIAFG
jgi:hypothetical protein